ncbi:OmpH family outer membrane protein [Solimonas sp. SE-A11]|uniref:OmpH family outer membrane protein n=1 Tax=Solimonas sp. SE-A11 TaxID=3054954 RepID=UPI00259CF21D|nr:OmpH family outer membrane protein [Solimonas sp. SE-A11]MDM4770948.1 OmpH family outer membrane protein [Solimonas sp. SE-A11]
MRNFTRIISVMALASAAVLAVPAMAADGKVLSIRAAELVQQSPQFKAGADKIKAEFDRRKNELEAEAKRFVDDAEKFKKERDVLSAADASKREKDLTTRQLDLQYKQRQFQEDFANRDRQLTTEMMAKIKGVIVQVAKEKGADVVVQDPIFAADSVDITAEVLKRLQAGGGK